MTLKNLIGLGDVLEKQAFAFLTYLNGKTSDEELQIQVDMYCENMAKSFVSNHKNDLLDKQLLYGLRNHINDIGAKEPHSGYRFYEALYKQLLNFEDMIDCQDTDLAQ